jgi:hypothetical protein
VPFAALGASGLELALLLLLPLALLLLLPHAARPTPVRTARPPIAPTRSRLVSKGDATAANRDLGNMGVSLLF